MTVNSTNPMKLRSNDNIRDGVREYARLNRKEAAYFLGFAPATLANWALKGYGPPSFKVGGRRFYWLADLERFVVGGAA